MFLYIILLIKFEIDMWYSKFLLYLVWSRKLDMWIDMYYCFRREDGNGILLYWNMFGVLFNLMYDINID